jgi:hypothetical protein
MPRADGVDGTVHHFAIATAQPTSQPECG